MFKDINECFYLELAKNLFRETSQRVADWEQVPERPRTAISFRHLIILAANA